MLFDAKRAAFLRDDRWNKLKCESIFDWWRQNEHGPLECNGDVSVIAGGDHDHIRFFQVIFGPVSIGFGDKHQALWQANVFKGIELEPFGINDLSMLILHIELGCVVGNVVPSAIVLGSG